MGAVFFFNDTATTEIYTLSLHDALPIYLQISDLFLKEESLAFFLGGDNFMVVAKTGLDINKTKLIIAQIIKSSGIRSEEHTSELQSRQYLVCRLLLEQKKNLAARHYLVS